MKKRICIFLSVLVLFTCIFSISASADMGPKPQLTIKVDNPPQGLYYLDLLLPGDADGEKWHPNVENDQENNSYDSSLFNVLKEYNEPGWHTGLVQGTGAPMWGDIYSDSNSFHFRYFGLPGVGNKYKIIMVLSDGSTVVSEELTRKIYQEEITVSYSAETGIKVTHEKSKFLMFIIQFLPTIAVTLIIEILLLLVFKISIKDNLVLVLITNILTNLGLNLILFFTNISSGYLSSFMLIIPLEIAIIIAECITYAVLMKSNSKVRNVVYAIVANVSSAVLGFLILLIPGIFK